MKENILWLVVTVAGGHVAKDLLLPALAAKFVGGPESVTMMSLAIGSIFLAGVLHPIASAITNGDIRNLYKCILWIIFSLGLMVG